MAAVHTTVGHQKGHILTLRIPLVKKKAPFDETLTALLEKW